MNRILPSLFSAATIGLYMPFAQATLIGMPVSRTTVISSECFQQTCFQGDGNATGVILWPAGTNNEFEPFLSYGASSSGLGMYASIDVRNQARNGTVNHISRDVFTLGTIDPNKPDSIELTARLNVAGQSRTGGHSLSSTPASYVTVRSLLSNALTPGVGTINQGFGGGADETTRIQLGGQINGIDQPLAANILQSLTSYLTLDVGVPFELRMQLDIAQVHGWSGTSSFVQSDFSNSALIGFDLPEGYFITSARGYSQGVTEENGISVPEPGSLALLGAGLLGLVTLRRWRLHQ